MVLLAISSTSNFIAFSHSSSCCAYKAPNDDTKAKPSSNYESFSFNHEQTHEPAFAFAHGISDTSSSGFDAASFKQVDHETDEDTNTSNAHE
jgi:hypothetical protein